jgi:hypothetical protein
MHLKAETHEPQLRTRAIGLKSTVVALPRHLRFQRRSIDQFDALALVRTWNRRGRTALDRMLVYQLACSYEGNNRDRR